MSTLLDAGYFHIKATTAQPVPEAPASGDETLSFIDLKYKKDTAFLVHLKPGKDAGPPKGYQGIWDAFPDPQDKARKCVFIRLSLGDSDDIRLWQPDVEKITTLSFTPTETEKETLKYGLKHYGKQANRVAVLVDDLYLPESLSAVLKELPPERFKKALRTFFLPEDYERILAKAGRKDVLLVSERQSRNAGSKDVTKLLKTIGRESGPNGKPGPTAEELYHKTGFLLVKASGVANKKGCGDGEAALCSASILDADIAAKPQNPLVPLSRKSDKGNVASCGVLGLGQLALSEMDIRAEKPYDEIISVYHAKDDPDMRAKNADAAFMHAWLNPDSHLKYTHVTLAPYLPGGAVSDVYAPVEVRDKKNMKPEDILAELQSRGVQAEVIENGRAVSISSGASPDACRRP